MSDTSPTPVVKARWFKSSYSSPSQACVEVMFDRGVVHVRDSKNVRDSANWPMLSVSAAGWATLLGAMDNAH